MNRKYGDLYVQDVIPKDMYRGMDADNKQATVMNLLVAHQNMDEKTPMTSSSGLRPQEELVASTRGENFNSRPETGSLAVLAPGRSYFPRRNQAAVGLERATAMSEEIARIHQPAAEIGEEALKRAEELIEQEEGVQNKFRRLADFITAWRS